MTSSNETRISNGLCSLSSEQRTNWYSAEAAPLAAEAGVVSLVCDQQEDLCFENLQKRKDGVRGVGTTLKMHRDDLPWCFVSYKVSNKDKPLSTRWCTSAADNGHAIFESDVHRIRTCVCVRTVTFTLYT